MRFWLPAAVMAEPSQRPATKNACKTRGWNYSFFSSWWWAVCRPKHVEQLRNNVIINSTTRLHLVGSFCEIYITIHGSMTHQLYIQFGARYIHV